MRPPRPASHRCRCSWVARVAGVNKSAASPTAFKQGLLEGALGWQHRRAGLRLPVCLTCEFYNWCFLSAALELESACLGSWRSWVPEAPDWRVLGRS